MLKGRRATVPGMVSPGSSAVKRQAEAEGLDRIFIDAGLEWRDSGCSMCNGSNGELVAPGERCASTTNRNYEGRQGRGALTHIMTRKSFEKQGIKILTGAKVTKLDKKPDSVTATIDDGKGGTQTLTVDRVIAAVGVVGNIENLGLEKLGVKTERAAIVVDGVGKTSVPGIYAIGDVAGPPLLAHKAEHEGVICVEAIKGLNPHPINKRLIPGCTYCTPQIASVGLTEQAAKEQKIDIRVGRFPFVGNGKAIALGEDQGLVKVIFDKKTGQLLGAHMVGAEVTELIQGYVVAMNLETTEEELMHTVFPHPTLSEMMKEAVLDAYGRVLNI